MTESTKKEIVFFDMDNVLVDFVSGLDRVAPEIKAMYSDDGTGKPHYDDIPGIFSLMDPMPGAIEAVKAFAASDKLNWVKKHLDSDRPEGVFYKRIVLSHHKNLCAVLSHFGVDISCRANGWLPQASPIYAPWQGCRGDNTQGGPDVL